MPLTRCFGCGYPYPRHADGCPHDPRPYPTEDDFWREHDDREAQRVDDAWSDREPKREKKEREP